MQHKLGSSNRGFTLLEMMISLGLGVLVVGAGVQIFSKGLDATFTVQQRAQMQSDIRAAQNMLMRDISLAGSGLPKGGLALFSGTGSTPVYGGAINGGTINFPSITSGSSTVNYLYPIIPGYAKGVTITTGQPATDVISVAYLDTSFPELSKYAVTFTGTTTTSAKFTGTGLPTVNDPAKGLKVGDLLWFTGTVTTSGGTSTGSVIAEVTGVSGTSSPYTVSMATNDAMKLNQTGGNFGLSSIVAATSITASRIMLVTYYLDIPNDASGVGKAAPRLMRQVGGQTAVPIVENISDLRFTYDVYDDTKTPPTQTGTLDANMSTGGDPNLIRQVNIKHLTIRSALTGNRGYQGMDIQTTVSARNLGYSDRYPIQ